VVERDEARLADIILLLDGDDVQIQPVHDIEHALELLDTRSIDCMVLTPTVPGLDEPALVQRLGMHAEAKRVPIVLYAPSDGDGFDGRLQDELGARTGVREAHAPERLLQEAALLLHRRIAKL